MGVYIHRVCSRWGELYLLNNYKLVKLKYNFTICFGIFIMNINKLFACLILCITIFYSNISKASIAIISLNSFPDVKIAFVTNRLSADCFLLKSHFTQNLQFAKIKAAIVTFQLADKRVMIISNSMNANSPSCLLR